MSCFKKRLLESDFVKPDAEETTRHLVLFTTFCAVTMLVLYLIVPKARAPSCHWQRADLIFNSLFLALLSYLAFDATLVLNNGTVEQRWTTVTESSYWFEVMYIGMNLSHVPVTLLKKQSLTYKLQMMAHHALSIGCYVRTLFTGVGHFYVTLDGCCELSTFFLNLLFVLKELNLPMSHPAYVVAGGLLWLSYLVLRIVLFPTWLMMWTEDVTIHPDKTLALLTPLEKVVFPFTNVVLFALSCVWFAAISRGFVKALTGKSAEALKEGPMDADREAETSKQKPN